MNYSAQVPTDGTQDLVTIDHVQFKWKLNSCFHLFVNRNKGAVKRSRVAAVISGWHAQIEVFICRCSNKNR